MVVSSAGGQVGKDRSHGDLKKMGKESNNNKSESLIWVWDKMSETISVSHSFTLRHDDLYFFFLSVFFWFASTNKEVYELEVRVVKNSFKIEQGTNSIFNYWAFEKYL